MFSSDQSLVRGVLERDTRAIARVITLVENGAARGERIHAALYPYCGKAHIVGITGSPGAGKSTLVDQIGASLSRAGKKVGIVAVDPSSPFSGGAVLGDRVRMSHAELRDNVYIRSMASRGALGGIARATVDAVRVLDAAGFDVILVETVGVGQAEVDIVKLADTCLVVLVPGMGDTVQAFKAGILEIADILVINKSDRDGADNLQRDLRTLISLGEYGEDAWRPEIVRTIATRGEGVPELLEKLTAHRAWFRQSSEGKMRREGIVRETIINMVGSLAADQARQAGAMLETLVHRCISRDIDPGAAARKILSHLRKKS